MSSPRITDDAIVEERQTAQQVLRSRDVAPLYASVSPGAYGFTRTHLDLLDCLELGLAVQMEAAKHIRNILTPSGLDEAERRCLENLYSAYIGCAIILERLPIPTTARVRVEGTFATADVKILVEKADLAEAIVGDYVTYVEFYRRHSNAERKVKDDAGLLNCTRAYFTLLSGALRTLLVDAGHQIGLQTLRSAHLEAFDLRFEGCEVTSCAPAETSELLPVDTDDIVGNTQFIQAGLRLARDIAGFDFETRENPKRLNPVLFAMGDPGCGKTVTCHAIGNYFLKFCEERNIPARFLTVRRSDWASSYQNASAAQLIDFFKTKVAGFGGVVGVYWPDIDTAFAAREDPGVRSEEKNILGACFGIFDGTIIPKNGQWFMMCDANTLNMDKAAISRITQDPFQLKGPVSADDFVNLMRDKKLKNHAQFLQLSETEWKQLGDACIQFKLSGRSVENITRRAVSDIENFEYPDEYFKASLTRRREILKEQSRPLTFDALKAIIEHYYEFEKVAEERAYRARFQERVQEIVFNLSAQEAATGRLLPG